MAKKKSSSRRKAPSGFNKYAAALKATKGKTCDRKKVLRAVKNGASSSEAVRKHCR